MASTVTSAKYEHDSLTSSTFEPFLSTPSSSTVHIPNAEPSSRTPSSSHRSRVTTKRSLQEIFGEGSARENQIIDSLRAQKHERVIVQHDLKRRKLDHKVMEAQHQREHEREQHEYRMMQMRMATAQRTTSVMQSPQNVEGFGLLDELNSTALPSALPSARPYSDSTTYSI
jgi:hypothetical protein